MIVLMVAVDVFFTYDEYCFKSLGSWLVLGNGYGILS